MNGKCQRCDSPTKRSDRKFCSHACANAVTAEAKSLAAARVDLTCASCSGLFSLLKSDWRFGGTTSPPRFCSKRCDGASRVTRKLAACAWCGKDHARRATERAARAFCSTACRVAADATPGSRWSTYAPDKAMQRDYMRAYVAANRQSHNARSRAWAKANRDARNAAQAARRGRGELSRSQAREVFERCGRQCVACGSKDQLQLDHIVPIARGGVTKEQNMQILCRPCNQSKGARDFADWMLHVHGIEVLEVKA